MRQHRPDARASHPDPACTLLSALEPRTVQQEAARLGAVGSFPVAVPFGVLADDEFGDHVL